MLRFPISLSILLFNTLTPKFQTWKITEVMELEANLYYSWCSNNCVKSVLIQSYSGSHIPAFGLNMERYGVSECGKMLTRITPNTETFHAVNWYHSIFSVAFYHFLALLWFFAQVIEFTPFFVIGAPKSKPHSTLYSWEVVLFWML